MRFMDAWLFMGYLEVLGARERRTRAIVTAEAACSCAGEKKWNRKERNFNLVTFQIFYYILRFWQLLFARVLLQPRCR